jgi:hypothetical protein
MYRWIARINADASLDTVGAEARSPREIDQPEIGRHEPQVSTAARVSGIREVIAKFCHHGQKRIRDGAIELARYWRLRYENDRVRQRGRRISLIEAGKCAQRSPTETAKSLHGGGDNAGFGPF